MSSATPRAMVAMINTKRRTSTSNVVRPGRSDDACFAIRPKTVLSPRPTHTPTPLPLVHKVPCSAMFRDSMTVLRIRIVNKNSQGDLQLESVVSTVAGTALLSPVRIERSNRKSEETSTRRRSAGTFEPRVTYTTSPVTRSAAGSLNQPHG